MNNPEAKKTEWLHNIMYSTFLDTVESEWNQTEQWFQKSLPYLYGHSRNSN